MAALVALADWMQKTGRAKAAETATCLPPCRPVKNVHWTSSVEVTAYAEKELDELCPRQTTVKAPVFNIVDDCQTDAEKLQKCLSSSVGVQVGFSNALVNQFAKVKRAPSMWSQTLVKN